MTNLGLIYYKTCYDKAKKEGFPHLADGLKTIRESVFSDGDLHRSGLEGLAGFQSFRLKTTYPGLTAGLGYAHGVSSNDDSKLGFSFDYVTGQPYLPGSTVKGVLRSCFAYPDLARDAFQLPQLDVPALESAIFDGGSDVFLDAVVARGDLNKNIMGEDYITPHSDPIKSPVPIKLLKVLPGVVFEFRFLLTDTKLKDTTVTAQQKSKAFRSLLMVSGIGAKTNVGYGGLQEVTERKPQPSRPEPTKRPSVRQDAPGSRPSVTRDPFVTGQVYDAVVRAVKEAFIWLEVDGLRDRCSVHISEITGQRIQNISDHVSIGDQIRVKYLRLNDKGWHCFSMRDVT